jgi:hypothetical protein
MRVGSGFGVALSLLLLRLPARAEMPGLEGTRPSEDPTLRAVKPERRNGAVLGASGGIAFAGSSGYPNNARFFGNPEFYSSSPLLVGWSSSFFLMGALNDYVSFGPSVTIATFENAEWKSTGFGIGFRGEVFPFVHLLPVLADTSIFGQLGVGSTALRAKGPYPNSDGTQSFFGLGIHHVWRLGRLLGGHAAAGPEVSYDLIRAPSIERHWLTTGLRVVWYGGTVQLDR